jgi:E3 ubiquitin-protein ligase RNF5
MCPVCKAGISKDKVIPLYGRGTANQQDPREKVPPRPQGQRTEPDNGNSFNAFHFGDTGFQMSFGIGAFPFGLFASVFNVQDGRPAAPPPGSAQHLDDLFLSRIFLIVAVILIVWLFIA